ncbi:MAG: hypothetical protein K5829_07580 [Treponema sp.]|nr:hypothetical protein [Treponema sp.]
MSERIDDLLSKIDVMKIEKYGLSDDNRLFLKKLCVDNDFLNQFIEQSSEEEVFVFLKNLYDSFMKIGNNLEELVDLCDKHDELKDTFNRDILNSAVDAESAKDNELEDKLL